MLLEKVGFDLRSLFLSYSKRKQVLEFFFSFFLTPTLSLKWSHSMKGVSKTSRYVAHFYFWKQWVTSFQAQTLSPMMGFNRIHKNTSSTSSIWCLWLSGFSKPSSYSKTLGSSVALCLWYILRTEAKQRLYHWWADFMDTRYHRSSSQPKALPQIVYPHDSLYLDRLE